MRRRLGWVTGKPMVDGIWRGPWRPRWLVGRFGLSTVTDELRVVAEDNSGEEMVVIGWDGDAVGDDSRWVSSQSERGGEGKVRQGFGGR